MLRNKGDVQTKYADERCVLKMQAKDTGQRYRPKMQAEAAYEMCRVCDIISAVGVLLFGGCYESVAQRI